tara:strand:- start:233 stop:514 length:282 start_codon:yes stop_codon:yes gene_type:complete
MAINQQSNPTQSPTTVSQEDLKLLQDLREKVSNITLQFGQIAIEKLRLEETEKNLITQLGEIKKVEISLAKNLTNKYGKGSINPDTGAFVPLK